MRKYLLILFMLPFMAFAQPKTKLRSFNNYTIEYVYYDSTLSVAWETFGKRVYFKASIQVWKDAEKVGGAFIGVYCPDAENKKDDPSLWIEKAKNMPQ